jgi:hypothetical protein
MSAHHTPTRSQSIASPIHQPKLDEIGCKFIAKPESPAYGLALFNFCQNRFGPSFPHSNEWVFNMKTLSKSGGKRFQRKSNRAYTAKQAVLNHRLAILVSQWKCKISHWPTDDRHLITSCALDTSDRWIGGLKITCDLLTSCVQKKWCRSVLKGYKS